MHHYFDIRLRSDPAFPAHQMMTVLFSKLHRSLARAETTTIAVSFPGYGISPITLGDTLRLLGPQADLAQLSDLTWLLGLRDQTVATVVAPVPATAGQRSLRRVQAKSNPERLLRRQVRRHGVPEGELRDKYRGMQAEHLRLPYVTLSSSSTGQPFKLFLRLGPNEARSQSGSFNAYGLSQTATVPWF